MLSGALINFTALNTVVKRVFAGKTACPRACYSGMQTPPLTEAIAGVLQTALDGHGVALGADGDVVISISRQYYEHRMGELYQQTMRIIEQYFPRRNEDITLLFSADDGRLQQVFRVRRSAPLP